MANISHHDHPQQNHWGFPHRFHHPDRYEYANHLQKAVIQGFQYRDMLESGKVATVSELAQKVKQERTFLFRALSVW